MSFPQQLFGAWRACGLDAAAAPDGGVTFGCPSCASMTSRLEVADGLTTCPDCSWGAEGAPWVIAEAGREVNGKSRSPDADAKDADIAATLARIRYNPQVPPPPPVALYSLAGNVIATAENIMVVQAKMKAGKSAAIGAMIASTMEPSGDCLGFASANPGKLALLHFDTEQSGFDHYNLITRSLRRAERSGPPPWFYSYHVKGHSIATIRKMVNEAIDRAAQECGGVHSSIIDGIADLCADVNDAAEANALVAEMEALAMKYRTLLACVLHENHGSDSGKTRGHLGSQLARKAETNLRLEKSSDGVTLMFADTSRSVHITKKNAPGFKWCDDARAHVTVLSTFGAMAAEKEKEELQEIAKFVFETKPQGVSYTQLCESIAIAKGISSRSAERFVRKMESHYMVKKDGDRYVSGKSLTRTN